MVSFSFWETRFSATIFQCLSSVPSVKMLYAKTTIYALFIPQPARTDNAVKYLRIKSVITVVTVENYERHLAPYWRQGFPQARENCWKMARKGVLCYAETFPRETCACLTSSSSPVNPPLVTRPSSLFSFVLSSTDASCEIEILYFMPSRISPRISRAFSISYLDKVSRLEPRCRVSRNIASAKEPVSYLVQ